MVKTRILATYRGQRSACSTDRVKTNDEWTDTTDRITSQLLMTIGMGMTPTWEWEWKVDVNERRWE